MLLYAQKIPKITRLKLEDVRYRKGEYLMQFGKFDMPLDEDVAILMSRYLASRRALSPADSAEENDYLFTGRMRGEHLHDGTVYEYLQSNKITARQLYATSIIKAYHHGMRQPKMLMDAFGINRTTAMMYFFYYHQEGRDEIRDLFSDDEKLS
jgi:hypothetical protein